MKRIIAVLLAVVLVVSLGVSALASSEEPTPEPSAEQTAASRTVIDAFRSPDATEKPMARMWFPDATAGIDDNDTIAQQINALAAAGFGGVEIAMLSDSTKYTNDQAEYCGWGTPEWVSLLKKVYAAANAVPGGFRVDLTITAHWPPCVNTIDPNDDAASKQTAVSITPVTEKDIMAGSIELALPVTKTTDGKGAYFVFQDKLVSANIVKVAGTAVDDSSSGEPTEVPALVFSTLQSVPASVIEGKTAPAGIPDEAYCQANGWDYQSVIDAFGPEPADPNETAKVDADGNRRRMADVQEYYEADLSGLNATDFGDGEYVIITVFSRGTGQLFNGGASVVMHNRCYVMNFFDTAGIRAVTDYWDANILSDPELKAMITANGGSIFEDSIEANKTTNLWVNDMEDELKAYYGDDYPYLGVIAAIVAGGRTYGGFGASAEPKDYVFVYDDEAEELTAQRIVQDYNSLMGYLYETQHCVPASEWAAGFGSGYRAQTYDLTGLDIAGAAAIVDIPEGDNMTKGDGLRQLSAAVNLNDKRYLSMEAITGGMIYKFNWEDILLELTANFSWGVNRAIFHGSAYSKAINGYNADWPGWDPFGGAFGEPYTYRQIYWDDMNMVTDYVARNQAVLQNGTAKVDVAIVRDGTLSFENPSGNSFQALLDNGYSYNIMSEALLNSENAQIVENGRIYPDGPGYRAVILDRVVIISADAMQTILKYARAGVPVIVYASDPGMVYGTEKPGNTDAEVAELFDELLALENVIETETMDTIPQILRDMGVEGYARYSVPKLETSLYRDEADGTNYYYVFNNVSTFAGMLSAGTSGKYKTGDYGGAVEDQRITLTGQGTPYVLDAMTGEILIFSEYTDNGDGTITVEIDKLSPGASMIIAVSPTVFETDGVYRNRTELPTEALDLTDADWQVTLSSYGPLYENAHELTDPDTGIQTVDPSATKVVTIGLGTHKLGALSDIDVTDLELATLGVESLAQVSGKVTYATSFAWNGEGADLHFIYGNDQITGIKINGKALPVVNNLTDSADITEYLVNGVNTIAIELTTTLNNRAAVEHMALSASSEMGGNYGLTEITIVPYTTD